MEVDDENEENNVQIDMNLKGTNVVEGLRQMVLAGTIQSPLPPWLENVAASVASKIYINKDGVSKEEYEEDSDNEKYTIESIMAEQQQEEED
jgi:predicted ATPase